MTLGDRWGAEPDAPADPSMISPDYYRAKILEFQAVLNALDQSYQAATTALDSGALTMDAQEAIATWVADYLEKRDQFRGQVQAVNLAAEAANAAGLRMPVLSPPRSLGALPLVALAGVLGAVVVGMTWGRDAIELLNGWLKRGQLLEAVSPEQRAKLAEAMQRSDAAVAQANQGSLAAAVGPWVQYAAIAAMAYFAWRAYKGR